MLAELNPSRGLFNFPLNRKQIFCMRHSYSLLFTCNRIIQQSNKLLGFAGAAEIIISYTGTENHI